MKTFTLITTDGEIEVPGIEIKIDGYEEYNLILHRNIIENGKEGDSYSVTEITSGRTFSEFPNFDVIELIKFVEERLNRVGKIKIKKTIKNNKLE